MEKHQFKKFKTLQTCITCFRLESDSIHNLCETSEQEALRIQKEHAISNAEIAKANKGRAAKLAVVEVQPRQIVTQKTNNPEQQPLPTVRVETVLTSKAAPEDSLLIYNTEHLDLATILPDNNNPDPGPVPGEPDCPSHICPDCQNTWSHDYDCGKDASAQILCVKCATQEAVCINRPAEIEQIAQLASQNISGQERAGILTEHSSVVYNLIHDAQSGELAPDWQERLHVHIRDIEIKIESFRIKQLNSHKILTEETAKQLVKLTPEERAQHLRDAAKGRKLSEKKDKEAATNNKSQKKDAYQTLLSSLFKDIKSRKPKATDVEIQAIAEKQARMLKEMEDE